MPAMSTPTRVLSRRRAARAPTMVAPAVLAMVLRIRIAELVSLMSIL